MILLMRMSATGKRGMMRRIGNIVFIMMLAIILFGNEKQVFAQQVVSPDKEIPEITSVSTDVTARDLPKRPCPQGVEDRSSDLCAQWKAADAAQESANWTLGALLVGTGTLIAAMAAAIYAGRAALAAEKTARDARELGEAQVRAYLGLESMFVWHSTNPGIAAVVVPQLRNTGNSPARITKSSTGIVVGHGIEGSFIEIPIRKYSVERSSHGAGISFWLGKSELPDQDIIDAAAKKCRVFYFLRVAYQHVFSLGETEEVFEICYELHLRTTEIDLAKFKADPSRYVEWHHCSQFRLSFENAQLAHTQDNKSA